MPLRLKQLELQGYKTFATRTQFIFGDGITAVVGPNGSGKSNIADSIRWVLGEQSYSMLRGKKTEDMIFAGSELRPRASMAQAVLTFDNSDGWLPIDFNEVTITRQAYRDGQNEYLINGQRVRLRDVAELLSRCGLAERTYTIIGQGLVDSALSLKAEERRALFEEAAGIGVYRDKREDALRRLDQTARNLERVQDILAEIRPRLRTLERQAARARDFSQVKTDLDALLKVWYGYHWHAAQQALAAARDAAARRAAELEALQAEQQSLDVNVLGMRARIASLRTDLKARRDEMNRLRSERERLARDLAVADERVRALEAQRAEFQTEMSPLEADLAASAERAEAAQSDLARLRSELTEVQQETASAHAAQTASEAERRSLVRHEATARDATQRLAERTAELRLRLQQSSRDREQLTQARAHAGLIVEQAVARTAELNAELAERDGRLAQTRAERDAVEAELARLAAALTANEGQLAQAATRIADLYASETGMAARLDALEQARSEQDDLAGGARTVRQAAQAGRWHGYQGAILDHLQVAPEHDAAIGAALGLLVNAVLVDSLDSVEGALAVVETDGGRVALLPVPHLTRPPLPTAAADPEIIGRASSLVNCNAALRPAVDALLGGVLVVRSRQAAYRLLNRLPPGTQVVTLAGDSFAAGGPVVGGRSSGPTALSQARESHDLAAQLAAVQRDREAAEAERRGREAQAQSLRENRRGQSERLTQLQVAERGAVAGRDSAALAYERTAQEAQWRREQAASLEAEGAGLERDSETWSAELASLAQAQAQAEAELAGALQGAQQRAEADRDLAERLAGLQTRAAVSQRAVQDAETRAGEARRALTAAESLVNNRRFRLATMEADATALTAAAARQHERAAHIDEQAGGLAAELEPSERELARLEEEQGRVEGGEGQARAALHGAERANAEAQLDLARRREDIEAMRRRIEDDFGLVELNYGDEVSGPTPLPLGDIVARLPEVNELPDGLEELIQRRRSQIRRMGAINPEAPAEYAEVKERHDFLSTQVADLETAGVQLRQVVAEMDLLMEREFRRTFEQVAAEFRETFTRLFGGGTARLVLTDPDQLTTSGIDIVARLPGRRQQGLALLSGGERSLTACALVFALLRVSPTPFCVMDEVDAMLDEANVGRFRDLLTELSAQTQFVVITHNRGTVQAADTVYGVSVGADSASQVVSLKLDGETVAR